MLNPLKQLDQPRIIKAGEAFECLHSLVPMRKGFPWQTCIAAEGYVKEVGKMQWLRTMKIWFHHEVDWKFGIHMLICNLCTKFVVLMLWQIEEVNEEGKQEMTLPTILMLCG